MSTSASASWAWPTSGLFWIRKRFDWIFQNIYQLYSKGAMRRFLALLVRRSNRVEPRGLLVLVSDLDVLDEPINVGFWTSFATCFTTLVVLPLKSDRTLLGVSVSSPSPFRQSLYTLVAGWV